MKIFYLLIPVLSLYLIGCSSTYKVSDFPSRDKFYEDFNNSASDKTVKITLSNDSTFTNNGVEIVNDTLYCTNKKIENLNKKIFLSDIKEIKYSGSNFRKGLILLKDGESFEAAEINIENDTVAFSFTIIINSFNSSLSINKVKEVSYINHWLGVPPSLVSGTVIGIGTGTILGLILYKSGVDNGYSPGRYEVLGCTAIGIVAGGIWGWLNGYTYTYQFNP
jgi:hypothetical protein